MEYVRREPMKSASGREPTAFTMKTIKELLAEDQTQPGEAETMRTPLPKNQVQQPPHMRGAVPAPAKVQPKPVAPRLPALKTSAAPKIDADITAPPTALPKIAQQAAPAPTPTPEPAAKKKSLFGRLIGG